MAYMDWNNHAHAHTHTPTPTPTHTLCLPIFFHTPPCISEAKKNMQIDIYIQQICRQIYIYIVGLLLITLCEFVCILFRTQHFQNIKQVSFQVNVGLFQVNVGLFQVYMYIYIYLHKNIQVYTQPIVDRVAKNLEIVSETFSTDQNSAHGVFDQYRVIIVIKDPMGRSLTMSTTLLTGNK